VPGIIAKPQTFLAKDVANYTPAARPIFMTWRLRGSLPNGFAGCLPPRARLLDREEFRYVDRILDRAECGPKWLQDARIASCIVNRLARGQTAFRHYDLHAYVIMANHMHMLLTPHVPTRTLSDGLKCAIARMANRMLGRRGERFWEDDSFCSWLGDSSQFARVKNYIERNPLQAGLVANPEDWPWSSARRAPAPLHSLPSIPLAG
jgi:putative transposase